ncbi:unnamed protein product [Camellia sinensis]
MPSFHAAASSSSADLHRSANVPEPESLYVVDVKSELVCIHDSARPLVTTGDVKKG